MMQSDEDLIPLDGLADGSVDCRYRAIEGGLKTDLHLHGFQNQQHLALCHGITLSDVHGTHLTWHGCRQIRRAIVGRGGSRSCG